MAKFLYTGTPPALPPLHSRGYYRFQHLATHYMRKYAHRRVTFPYKGYTGYPHTGYWTILEFNRALQETAMKRWKEVLTPSQRAGWYAEAYMNALETWTGDTHEIDGPALYLMLNRFTNGGASFWPWNYPALPWPIDDAMLIKQGPAFDTIHMSGNGWDGPTYVYLEWPVISQTFWYMVYVTHAGRSPADITNRKFIDLAPWEQTSYEPIPAHAALLVTPQIQWLYNRQPRGIFTFAVRAYSIDTGDWSKLGFCDWSPTPGGYP
jgi:hypothetical protein